MWKFLRALIWFSAIYLLVCTAAALFLASTTLHPSRRGLRSNAEDEARQNATQVRAKLYDVEITTSDRVRLRGWHIRPLRGKGDEVILLHGLGDNRLGTVGYAEIFLRHGYSVLMPDARAHGVSGGELATYGVLERDDIKTWFKWLEQTDHPRCIYGLGESMGAAQLLQSLAAGPNFCAVIAESSFSSFREIAYDRMGQQFHAGPWVGRTVLRPVVEIALAYVRLKDHIDLAKASPEEAVARTRVPVLLVHGVEDSNIPVYHSRELRSGNPNVELWEVPGADHCGAISVARAEFEKRVLQWFDENQAPRKITILMWRPLPDSNRNRRFRKPELYPVELRGRANRLSD